MSRFYRMFDADPRGAVVTTLEEAATWNAPDRRWGIFWTVNTFRGPRRIENLERINAWAVDLDAGTKAEQLARLESSPLVPSCVVETKRGHQAYWSAKDATAGHWNAIVLDRLVPYFGADKNARDLARILRVPGFSHWKDPADPFLVRKVWQQRVAYREHEIAQAFPAVERPTPPAPREMRRADEPSGDTFWDRVHSLDCMEALRRLSGHPAVNGERYSFRRTAGGTHNILVDGKGTACWVDKAGRIGSLAHGGPGIYQWLGYFGHSPSRRAEVIKELFPTLEVR